MKGGVLPEKVPAGVQGVSDVMGLASRFRVFPEAFKAINPKCEIFHGLMASGPQCLPRLFEVCGHVGAYAQEISS